MGQRDDLFLPGLILLIIGLPSSLPSQEVTPSERVRTHVNVRETPGLGSEIIEDLHPSERAAFLDSVPHWYHIRLGDGTEGFVSKAWTDLVIVSAWAVHFLDVGTGDAAIIDVGDSEIVIDGGNSPSILHNYAAQTGIITDPIELVVVTHGDTDHWKGFLQLLGFDPRGEELYSAEEIWDPGYNRDCNPPSSGGRQNYLAFVEDLQGMEGALLRRPLELTLPPATTTSVLDTVRPFSGVSILVLHTDQDPQEGECSYRINNASIVLKILLPGGSFLFTGDANGKERDEASPGTPGHVEQKLLALNELHAGLLHVDVLKVPHHGSETASTQDFITAVDPNYAIISASTSHHLPRDSVVMRYDNGERVILRTDRNRPSNNDHIICRPVAEGVTCDYAE